MENKLDVETLVANIEQKFEIVGDGISKSGLLLKEALIFGIQLIILNLILFLSLFFLKIENDSYFIFAVGVSLLNIIFFILIIMKQLKGFNELIESGKKLKE
jgi:hypothetical protein